MHWDPNSFDDQLLELAIRRHQSGQLEEAMANCRQVLAHQPNHPAALHLVGLIARQIGRLDAAVELIRRSAAGNTKDPHFHNDLANALRDRREFDEAMTVCREALRLKPEYPEAYVTLGNILADQGQFDGAVAAIGEALRMRPDYALGHNNLGVTLHNQGKTEEAIAAGRKAVQLDPAVPEFHNNLGRALQDMELLEESIAERREAIRLRPDFTDAYNDLGNALRDVGQDEESIEALRRCIQLAPNYALAHWNLSLSLLVHGDLTEGWREYEWRWRWDGFTSPRRGFSQPLWAGEPLNGKTLLLYAEQGMGDAIQFMRYLPMVAKRAGRIIVECQPPLKSLFSKVHSVQQAFAEGETLPAFDVQCPLLTLPLIFRNDLNNIPATVPYLKADRKKSGAWKQRLSGEPAGRRVGLVWAGSATHKRDRTRSLSPAIFAPLASVPGNVFFSLQKGEPAKQPFPSELQVRDFTQELNDFSDTAALVDNLDLVITVDTAVAHLAGAMGKPVWVLLAHASDWRWLRERTDSPWYPSMRLFRQTKPGEWGGSIEEVGGALRKFGGK